MKKFILLSAIALGVMASSTSCGNKNSDDGTLKPPFTIVGSVYGGGWHDQRQVRTYTYEIKDDGMYTLTINEEFASKNDNIWLQRRDYPKTYEGRWTTCHRRVGEGEQKVYEIHLMNGESDYIPEVPDYMWLYSAGGMFDGYPTWEECANFNTSHATQVAEYITAKGDTTVVLSVNERYPDVEPEPAAEGVVLNGKTFVNESGNTLTFTENEVTFFDSETNETKTGKYGLAGQVLSMTPLNVMGAVSESGFNVYTGDEVKDRYFRKDIFEGLDDENYLEGKTYKSDNDPNEFWISFKDGIATLTKKSTNTVTTYPYKYSDGHVEMENLGGATLQPDIVTLWLVTKDTYSIFFTLTDE